jgi:hypothetical protein
VAGFVTFSETSLTSDRRTMNRNIALDVLAYFSFCALVGTGLLLEFRLCEDANATILGLAAEDWRDIHEWVAYSFVVLVVLHLALHWAWIRKLASGHLWSTAVGFAAGVCTIGALLLTPMRHSEWHNDYGPEKTREHDD